MGDGEADEIEAEAGVDWISQGVEAFAKETEERCSVAHGTAGFDDEASHGAVCTEQAGFKHAAAFAAFAQLRAGFLTEFEQDVFNIFDPADGFGKTALDP